MNKYIVEYVIKPNTTHSQYGRISIIAKSSPLAERIAAHRIKRAHRMINNDLMIIRVIGVHGYRTAVTLGKIPA